MTENSTTSLFVPNFTNSTIAYHRQDETHLARGVVMIALGLLIALENSAVLFVAFRNKILRENIHYNLVLSLSASDLLLGINATIFGIIHSRFWVSGFGLLTLCRINYCIGYVAFLMSIWQTFFISLNRYLVISEKKLNQLLWKGKRRYVVYCVTWICNIVLYLSMMAPKDEGGHEYGDHICNPITVYGDHFAVWNDIFFALIAFSLLFTFVFYILALWNVRKRYIRTADRNPLSGSQNGALQEMAIRQRNRIMKSMKLVTIVLVVLIVSLCPTLALGFIPNLPPIEYLILLCFSLINSAVNPIIYCIQIDDFKKEVKKILKIGPALTTSTTLSSQ